MKNGMFGEKRCKNGQKNGRKAGLSFAKIRSSVSGVGKWEETEVSGGLRKIGDFIGLNGAKVAHGWPIGKEKRSKLCINLGCSARYTQMVPKWLQNGCWTIDFGYKIGGRNRYTLFTKASKKIVQKKWGKRDIMLFFFRSVL